MCTIVAHSNYLLQLWFKKNVCLNELTIGSSALFILTEGHRLSDAYPSFRAKGRINPPRQRLTCTQIPNCRANAAISCRPIHPSVSYSCQEHILCSAMFLKLHWWIKHRSLKELFRQVGPGFQSWIRQLKMNQGQNFYFSYNSYSSTPLDVTIFDVTF
jgi:hypothetical protein